MRKKIHTLKIDSKYLDRIIDRSKLFEIRKNDRDFQTGDDIFLIENAPDAKWCEPTDPILPTPRRTLTVTITYVLDFPEGLKPGYVGLGIKLY